MNDKSWREIVAKAEAYIALDQIEHYLYFSHDGDYPWQYAVSCQHGGSHRLDIYTDVRFRAEHPSGLNFVWSFDIEPYSANLSPKYEIDIESCLKVLSLLTDPVKAQFEKYLLDCAKVVRKNAVKYDEIARREHKTADDLELAAGMSATKSSKYL